MSIVQKVIEYDIKYISWAIVLVFIYILLDSKYSTRVRIIDIIAIAVMVILSALRDTAGSDYLQYLARYAHYNLYWDRISKSPINEKLFYYLGYCFSKITDSPYGIFWMCALLLYPVLVITARKITGKPSRVIGCYVFLEFYAVSNNILRQAIAMELIMLGYFAWKYNKKCLAIILIVLSLGFHTSAGIGILLIIISEFVKPNFTSLGFSIALGFFLLGTWRILGKVFKGNILISRYIVYLQKTGMDITRKGMYGYILFYIFIILLLLIHAQKIKSFILLSNLYDNLVAKIICSIPFFFVATQMSYANRVALYLYQFAIFVIPPLFDVKVKNKVLFRIMLIIILVLWLAFSNIVACDNTFWQYELREVIEKH